MAQERVAEINVRFDETVRRIRAGLEHPRWSKEMAAAVRAIDRQDGKVFLRDIAGLSASVGRDDTITVVTQKRIWSFVKGFMEWVLQEGHVEVNPFRSGRFEGKGGYRSYAVPTDAEVAVLLAQVRDPDVAALLRLCLLTGMRLGKACGQTRHSRREIL